MSKNSYTEIDRRESDASNSVFEPFSLVLASSAAGYHDGLHLAVDIKTLADPVIACHEGVHQKIFSDTPDGQVLSSFLMLLGVKKEWGQALPTSVEPLANLLVKNSRFAHETVATYLAIKLFSPGPGDKVYERLPAKYKEYYNTLADVVEKLSDRSRVQRVMAEAISDIVFDSYYQARLVDTGLESAPDPDPEELPDERLRRALDTLSHSEAKQLAETLNTTHEAMTLKISKDASERGLDFNHERPQAVFDSSMSIYCRPIIREYLVKRSGLPSLSIESSHRRAVLHKFTDMMRPFKLKLEIAEDPARTKAFWQGRSLLINKRLLPCEQGDDRILAGDEVFGAIREFQLLSAEPPDHLDRWIFVGFSGQRPPSGGYFSTDAVLNWLGRCRDREREGRSCPQARAITVAVRRLEEIQAIQKLLMKYTSIKDDAGSLRGRSAAVVTWYWRESWLELLSLLCEMGPLQGMEVRQTKSEGRRDEPEVAVVLKVINSGFIRGHVMRVLSVAASEDVRSEESRLLQSGKLSSMENDLTRRAASYAAQNSFQLIQDYWSRF